MRVFKKLMKYIDKKQSDRICFNCCFSTLLSVVAYASGSRSTKLQLFSVLKMNFKRDISVKEKKSIQS